MVNRVCSPLDRIRQQQGLTIGSMRALLSRPDWVYLLSLLIPLFVYTLALKAYDIASQPSNHEGLAQALSLMWSDVFFNLGYALLWIALFAMAQRRPLRLLVIFLFHVTTMLVVVTTTVTHHYFLENGTTLDYGTIAEWIPKFEEIVPILFEGGVPLLAWILLAAALLYVALGPLLVARIAGGWRGWPEGRIFAVPTGTTILGSLGIFLLALGFGSFSLLSGTTTLGRAPFVNVVLTGIEQALVEEDVSDAAQLAEHPAAHASLPETSRTEKRNVVLIHLESTRAQSVTPYNEDLKTTPYLD